MQLKRIFTKIPDSWAGIVNFQRDIQADGCTVADI
jgi:hypothetical protein